MSADPKSRTSFSPGSRWKIGFDVVLRTALVLAVVVMANFLGAKVYHRFYLSQQTRVQLSTRTLGVLHSLTNQVKVTLYYDHKADFYPDIVELLNVYHAANPNVTFRTVDYNRDAGEAGKVKAQYNLSMGASKNLVIFDYDGRWKVVPGDSLTDYKRFQVPPSDPKQKELEFERRPVQFNGELAFTAMLIALESPQPIKAYFLQGHGEPSLTDNTDYGYSKFGAVLAQNYIAVTNYELTGDAPVPMDCNLLVIAAPVTPFAETELQKIDQYLHEGGRLFVLFNSGSIKRETGLEAVLQRWGVSVFPDVVQDKNHTFDGQDVITRDFGKHPIVDSLAQLSLQIVFPRPVVKINPATPSANAPEVEELVMTSPEATLYYHPSEPPHTYPLACAVEQKPVAGVTNPRGNTRIVVVGDSIFVGNHYIESGAANRDFLNASANWLCDRPQLLNGIGQRPVTEYRLTLTGEQQQKLRWLLLGALPGGVLVFGWLVWLVRRK